MRKTAKCIAKALTVAIRLHRNSAGTILFDFLDGNLALRGSCSPDLGTYLFQDAVRSTNTTLISRALDLDNRAPVAKRDTEHSFRYELNRKQIEFLFRSKNTAVLGMLLRDAYIRPNDHIEGLTLLAYALKMHRRPIARTLLDHGADVNGLSPKDGVTALWYATKDGYYHDVLLLFENGAGPKYPDTPEKSPHQLQQDRWYDYQKTKWLFKQAIRNQKYFEEPGYDIDYDYRTENWGNHFW